MSFEDRIRLPPLGLIHRRVRLLTLLNELVEANNRLITVYAPGGYGKSILLADFAQTTDLPVCWCSLEPADRDPTSFLTLLAFSITDRFHEINPDKLLDVVKRGETQNSIHHIAELLANVGPHIIIIDDYHKAVSAGMTLALNRLLDQLPKTGTIIVAARGDMALETGQIIDLLMTERAAGLSEEELRFTPDELQRVIRKRFGRHIDLERAAEIAKTTDGNIAQILLTGHVMHKNGILGGLIERLGEDRQIIYHYLAEEVFGKQPAPLQEFMLCTSVLPDMTPELCNGLLEISDAQSRIEELIRNDLFIAQIGVGFRYHDLFAEFLRSKLAEDATLQRQVSMKAAALLMEQERVEEAINLYLSVQAWAEAALVLETKGKFFYDTGRALTLNNWLEQISEADIEQYPRLLLLRGQILTSDLGNPKQAMLYFQWAEAQFLSQNYAIGLAETLVWRSYALRMMGQANESLTLATKGLEQLETLGADIQVIAWAIRRRGLAYWTTGNLDEALVDLRQALALFEKFDDLYNIGLCHHEVGVILDIQGNISGAAHHFREALRIWETLGNAVELTNILNSLGVSLQTIGHFDEALKYLNNRLDIALQIGATRVAAFAQASIGDVYLGYQKYGQAIEAYKISTQLAQEASARSLEIYNLVRMGDCFFQQQNLTEALTLATQAGEIATEIGLGFERGLASLLQAKIMVHRAEYAASFDLFAEAVVCLTENDVLEHVKARLWWGYGLLLDLRASAALEQIQEAISLALTMGELIQGLRSTVIETQQLLYHFLHRADTPVGLRESIWLLLNQSQEVMNTPKPALQIFAFGPLNVIVAGERKQFHQRGKTRKMPEFLIYLLLEGRSWGRRWSEISAIFWPDEEPERASDNFHHHLRSLRRVVFETQDYIINQDDYYLINPDYLQWSDVLAFETLYERAAQLPSPKALALQLELIALYQGQFLEGFDLSDWGLDYRYTYEARFLEVVKLAAEQLLKEGSAREALNIINKGLAQDYFREDLHRSAFRAYAQLGLYDQLSTYYSELCRRFEQTLEIPPDSKTQQLYDDLIINS
jgi:tetratricopeptide (TPR) repeat protein